MAGWYAGGEAVAMVTVAIAAATALAQPRLELVNGYLDAGAHARQSQFSVEGMVCNAGDDPLQVTDVRSNCPCVIPEVLPQRLGPGECATVSAHVETRDAHGPQERTITLVTNDPLAHNARIRLRYSVGITAQAAPRVVWFGLVKPGKVVQTIVEIEALLGDSGAILYAVSDDPAVSPVVVERSISAASAGQLRVSLTSSDGERVVESSVRVYTTIPDCPVLHIPVQAVITRRLAGDLVGLNMGRVATGTVANLAVALEMRDAKPPRIVSIMPGELNAWFETPREDRTVNLLIQYAATAEYGPFRGRVTVTTSGSPKLKFTIPVSGEVVPAAPDYLNAQATHPSVRSTGND